MGATEEFLLNFRLEAHAHQAIAELQRFGHSAGGVAETIYELLNRGELASISIGRARRIPLSSLRSFVAAELERSGPARVCDTPADPATTSAKAALPVPLGAFFVANSDRRRAR